MSPRTDRLLSIHVVLLALLVVSQTTTVPRNPLLGAIGLVCGSLAVVFGFAELLDSYRG